MNLAWSPNSTPAKELRPERFLAPEGFIEHYSNLAPFNDEPRLYHMRCRIAGIEEQSPDLGLGFGGGSSLSLQRALNKMIGEAGERFALIGDHQFRPIQCFKDLAGPALDPDSITQGRRPASQSRRGDHVQWIPGFKLLQGPHMVPRQLIDVPFVQADEEVMWRVPITTGAAAGSSREEALFAGLCEVVERDAFMTSWLRQLSLHRLSIKEALPDSPTGVLLSKLITSTRRYHLEVNFLTVQTLPSLITVICVLTDESGLGAPVVVAAKTSNDPLIATLGSLEEAHQIRPWTRYVAIDTREESRSPHPSTLRERALLYFQQEAIDLVSNWVSGSGGATELTELIAGTDRQMTLDRLVSEVIDDGGDVFFVDLTPKLPQRGEDGLYATKVVVPQYQPLFLTERYADIAVDRIATVERRTGLLSQLPDNEIAEYPHPFL
ncbi:MAG: YcaO-like family protein [Actinomycetota bacterium]